MLHIISSQLASCVQAVLSHAGHLMEYKITVKRLDLSGSHGANISIRFQEV